MSHSELLVVDNEATECEERREIDREAVEERTAVSWAILCVTTTMPSLTLLL